MKVNYKGTLIDGTEFDSSYKRNEPATFRANQVIKGWTEALTMMPVGSKWELYIPYDLAYGSRETGSQIKPFSTLISKWNCWVSRSNVTIEGRGKNPLILF